MALLKTCSLDELKKEPWRLQLQADHTAEQLRNLVLKNYHVFIQSNQCSAIVKDDLNELKRETNQIMDVIPELSAFWNTFQSDIATAVAKHGDIQFIFDHYIQLTELLEIPQLLEACIHNELFDSALDVIQFAKETFDSEKDQATTPNFVISSLVREVQQLTGVLREKLLQRLRDDLQLALCVRIVSYLRRLDALTDVTSSITTPEYEKRLKEEFLSCRNVWLSSLSRGVSSMDPYQYIIQVIDIKRTSWFDMITQYSAIFGSETVDGKVDPPLCRWATTTVADFIQILMKQLPKIEDLSSLATIFEQSLFFGGSLGRVGVDFRAVLIVHFEDHVFDVMTQKWRCACRDFEDTLRAHSLGGGTGFSSSRTPIVMASFRHGSANGHTPQLLPRHSASNEDDYSPPRQLMAFPILAEFTNALLTSLNELRLCTIASLQNRLARKFQGTLCAMLLSIADFCEANKLVLYEQLTSNDDEHSDSKAQNTKAQALTESIRSMNQAIQSEFIPYMIKCFYRLFPMNQGARSNSHTSATSRRADAPLQTAFFEEIMQASRLIAVSPAEAADQATTAT